MEICIAGKSNIAVDVLNYIYCNYKQIYSLSVVCNMNETGVDSWQKSLRNFAKNHNITEKKLEDLYDEENLIFISLEYDKIINPKFFKTNRLFNIHFSLLPKYKGMYTSAIPILNGEKYTGVTLHKIDMGIDTGDIVAQKKFLIKDEDNCRDVYFKLLKNGTKLVIDNIDSLVNGTYKLRPQGYMNSSYYPKKYLNYKELRIDFVQTAENIIRQIRAFSFREYQLPSYEGYSIIQANITKDRSIEKPGKLLCKDDIKIIIATIDYNVILYIDRFDEIMDICKNDLFEEFKRICILERYYYECDSRGNDLLNIAKNYSSLEIIEYIQKQKKEKYIELIKM